MNPPAATVWLDAWERGMSAPPVRRPAVLLEAWHGPEAQPAAWPLGQREAALLGLRAALFGNTLESLAPCPQCGGTVEFTLNADDLLRTAPAAPAGEVNVFAAGHSASFRLPDTHDLEAAAAVPAAQRERFLLQRCRNTGVPPVPVSGRLDRCGTAVGTTASQHSQNGCAPEWPDEFLSAAAQRMADADPLGDITLSLTCPDCAHAWDAPFDTGDFLWTELHAWAARLMSEIHILAATYGWTEREILALPLHRRRFYLERTAAQP